MIATDLPPIEKAWELEPGKTYALIAERPITAEEAQQIRERFEAYTDCRVVILDGLRFATPTEVQEPPC